MLKKLIFIISILNFSYLLTEDFQEKENNNTIEFSFVKEKLSNIVEKIAKKKNINIIPPRGYQSFFEQTVSYETSKIKINIDKAWKLLNIFLELSGYSLFKKDEDFYQIVPVAKKDEEGISRQPLNLYIDTNPNQLPIASQRIRYVYYLKNLKIDQAKDYFNQIFKDMSSDGAHDPIYLDNLNGFIVVDKAYVVSSIIKIIEEIDKSGYRQLIEIIQLHNVNAIDVAEILRKIKLASGEQKKPYLRSQTKASISYFIDDTKIIPTHKNRLILMGRQTEIERISEFISEHIDTPPESGKSILHVYNLQYLKADEFDKILREIVTSKVISRQADQKKQVGPYKFFQKVVVKGEKPFEIVPKKEDITADISAEIGYRPPPSQISTFAFLRRRERKGIAEKVFGGGNRLIIAANNEDWKRIKKLIKKLDQPQPQVILEVMVVDFNSDKLTKTAGTNRNRTNLMLPSKGNQFLASHITRVNNVLGSSPDQLAQDLLAVVGSDSVTSNIEPGSLLISFNDKSTPGIFGLLQILNTFVNMNIIAHPFLVAKNNSQTEINEEVIKRARGDVVNTEGGSFIIGIDDVTSKFGISMTPQIASKDQLKLNITVSLEDFKSPTGAGSLDKFTRFLKTTSYLHENQILVIGGLTRTEWQSFGSETPIIGKIPFIRSIFAQDRKRLVKRNLAIFISPKIIMPKQHKFSEKMTKNKVKMILNDDEFIQKSSDPIIKLFFQDDEKANTDLIEEFFSYSNSEISENKYIDLTNLNESYLYQEKNGTIKKANNLKTILEKKENPFKN